MGTEVAQIKLSSLEDTLFQNLVAYGKGKVNSALQSFPEYAKQRVYEVAAPHIKSTFNTPLEETLLSSGSYLFSFIQESIPLCIEAFKTSKAALNMMFQDLFEVFVFSSTTVELLHGQEALALGMCGAAFAAHQLAIKYLKEDPKQADSITYGALTGIFTSYVMNHDVGIGMLSGAVVGLITDTAKNCITYSRVTKFFKRYYKKLKIQETTQKIHTFASQVFPYLFFTLGTALVYSKLSPLIDKVMEGEIIPSKKMHIIKVIFVSGMLFGMAKSYVAPVARSLLGHVKIGIQSAYDTGMIASWIPRILTILCATSIISARNK